MRYFILLMALVLSSCSHDDSQVNNGWVIYDLRPLEDGCIMYYGEDERISIFYNNRLIKFLRFFVVNESHTSKCSSYDLEKVCHHNTYVGKRLKRGIFRTKDGVLLNADVNGSYNIMRKVKGDAVMPPYTGFGYNPVKKFIN